MWPPISPLLQQSHCQHTSQSLQAVIKESSSPPVNEACTKAAPSHNQSSTKRDFGTEKVSINIQACLDSLYASRSIFYITEFPEIFDNTFQIQTGPTLSRVEWDDGWRCLLCTKAMVVAWPLDVTGPSLIFTGSWHFQTLRAEKCRKSGGVHGLFGSWDLGTNKSLQILQ